MPNKIFKGRVVGIVCSCCGKYDDSGNVEIRIKYFETGIKYIDLCQECYKQIFEFIESSKCG